MAVLVALLFCIYTFTNAGHLHRLDEASHFALTESLALRGEVDTNAVAWLQERADVSDRSSSISAFGVDGDVVRREAPTSALLGVVWYYLLRILARLGIQLGLLQGMLLWNGLVTALTAAVIWLTILRLGYTDRVGASLGLLFGLGTIAWPYAEQLGSEPLAALALLTCYFAILSWRQFQSRGWLWLSGGAAAIALSTNVSHFLLVLLLIGYCFYVMWQTYSDIQAVDSQSKGRLPLRGSTVQSLPATRSSASGHLVGILYFLLPLGLAAGLLLWYNFARFGSFFEMGNQFSANLATPVWQGLWGFLVSPLRGIFWYSPIFLASLIAMPRFVRRHRGDGWFVLALILVGIGVNSFSANWWDGTAWGPRLLVPLTPLFILLLVGGFDRHQQPSSEHSDAEELKAENVEAVVESDVPVSTALAHYDPKLAGVAQRLALESKQAPSWLTPLIFAPFIVISILVQIGAVSLNYVNFESRLNALYPVNAQSSLRINPPAQAIGDFLNSPVIGQFRLLREGLLRNSDLAWLPTDGDVRWLLLLIAIAAIVTLGYLLYDWWVWSTRRDAEHPGLPLLSLILLIPLLLASVWLGETANDPYYGMEGQGYRAVLRTICAGAQADDALISIAPSVYQIPMNWFGGACPRRVSLYGYDLESATRPETVSSLQKMLGKSRQIWYLTDGLQGSDPANSVEYWLAQNGYKASDEWFDQFRLVRYATPRLLIGIPTLQHDALLSDNQNNQVTILSSKAPISAKAGDVIPIQIEYQLNRPTTSNLRWFVQLLNQDGNAIAQLDTAPDDNYLQFSAMAVNHSYVEFAGLALQDDLPPGQYQLIAGLYNPLENGQRLQLSSGTDFVLLSFISVE